MYIFNPKTEEAFKLFKVLEDEKDSYIPYLELSFLSSKSIRLCISENEVLEVSEGDYENALSRLAIFVSDFGRFEPDPNVYAHGFDSFLRGHIPTVVGDITTPRDFIEYRFTDFLTILAGYLVRESSLFIYRKDKDEVSKSRKHFNRVQAIVFASLFEDIHDFLNDKTSPKNGKIEFAKSVFFALGNLALFNSMVFEHNRVADDTAPLSPVIHSGQFTNFELSGLYFRMANTISRQVPSNRLFPEKDALPIGMSSSTDAPTQPPQ